MSDVTVNGLRVLQAEIHMPVDGAWWADVSVDTAAAVSGRVTLSIDGTTFVGTVVRGEPYVDGLALRLVGGAGGLGKVLEAKHYLRPTASLVASDIVGDSGETLEATSALDKLLDGWTRIGGATAGAALTNLSDTLGVPWRVTAAGNIIFGEPTWADAKIKSNEVISRLTAEGSAELARFVPPGMLVLGAKVTRATVHVQGRNLRYCVHLAATTGGVLDRLKTSLRSLVKGFGAARLDYLAHYSGEVVGQSGDTFDVKPDDPRIPPMSGLEYDLGLPGASVKVPKGTRVTFGWRNGDPIKPYVSGFLSRSAVTEVSLDGSQGVARVGDVVSVTLLPGVHSFISPPPPSGVGPFTPATPITLTGTILSGSARIKA